MNEVILTVTGNVVTDPVYRTTKTGEAFVSFRVAVNERRRTPDGGWVDGEATYFSVTAFRVLASNVYRSVSRGQLVTVTGRLRISRYEHEGQIRTSVQIDAHDIAASMKFGVTTFERCTTVMSPANDRMNDDNIDRTVRELEGASEAHSEEESAHGVRAAVGPQRVSPEENSSGEDESAETPAPQRTGLREAVPA